MSIWAEEVCFTDIVQIQFYLFHSYPDQDITLPEDTPSIPKTLPNGLLANLDSKLLIPDRSKAFGVTTEEGQVMAKDIGAKSFVECSSLTGEGVDKLTVRLNLQSNLDFLGDDDQ